MWLPLLRDARGAADVHGADGGEPGAPAPLPGTLAPNLKAAQLAYERALTLDPAFALAHAALSHVHGRMYWFRYDATEARTTSGIWAARP